MAVTADSSVQVALSTVLEAEGPGRPRAGPRSETLTSHLRLRIVQRHAFLAVYASVHLPSPQRRSSPSASWTIDATQGSIVTWSLALAEPKPFALTSWSTISMRRSCSRPSSWRPTWRTIRDYTVRRSRMSCSRTSAVQVGVDPQPNDPPLTWSQLVRSLTSLCEGLIAEITKRQEILHESWNANDHTMRIATDEELASDTDQDRERQAGEGSFVEDLAMSRLSGCWTATQKGDSREAPSVLSSVVRSALLSLVCSELGAQAHVSATSG